jgi:FkbM family methyltransferase|tara:strand:- start:13885 stop:14604 length:720 start_codon:yes stop_codon:yes gene_type:complete
MLIKNVKNDFFDLDKAGQPSISFINSPSNFATTIVEQINNDIYKIVENYVDKDSIVVDAGANIGYFSYYISPIVKEIHCFEPTPDTFKILELIKESADLSNLVLNQAALGRHTGKCAFSICPENETMNSIEGLNGSAKNMYEQSIEVDCYTLVDYLNNNKIDKVDFIKIDIEGGEKHVLFDRSFEDLNGRIGALLIEVHLFDEHVTLQSSLESVTGRLSECGYVCNVLSHDTILATYPT